MKWQSEKGKARQGKCRERKGPRRLIEVSLDFGKYSHADGVNKYWTGISHHLQREVGRGWEIEESKEKTKERSNSKDISTQASPDC